MYGSVPQIIPAPQLAAGEWRDRGKEWMHDKKARFTSHTENLRQFLTKKGTTEELLSQWLYFIFKCLASLGTLFLLIVLCITSSNVVFGDNTESSVYMTNTFYTSNDKENNVSWQVLTSSPWNAMPRPTSGASYATHNFEHFYECMWIAQEGAGLCNSSAVTATVATYKTCLDTSYSAQLSSCASFGAPEYWPTSNQYTGCINDKLAGGNVWNLNAFRTCVRESLWPLYEIPQDVTSTFFLGAYSWPMLAITSTFLLFIFGLYTWYPVDWEDATVIERGKPASSYVRLGMLWSGLALLVALFWLLIVLLVTFRTDSTWPDNYANSYPSTYQTNVVMVTATIAVVFYFLFEVVEFRDRYEAKRHQPAEDGPPVWRDVDGGDNPWAYGSANKIPTPALMGKVPPTPAGQAAVVNPMGYYFPNAGERYEVHTLKDSGDFYSPVLLKTWADAYLVDPLFAVGVLGATQQVSTADVYNIFFGLLFYRIAHVGIARTIYFAYIEQHKVVSASQTFPEALAATKVLGLALNVAAAFALLVPLLTVFDSGHMLVEYPLLTNTFVLCYVVPELIRFIGHVILSVTPHEMGKHKGIYILMGAQFIWCWDVLVRCFVLWFLLLSYGYTGSRGTKSYLLNGNQAIMSVMSL